MALKYLILDILSLVTMVCSSKHILTILLNSEYILGAQIPLGPLINNKSFSPQLPRSNYNEHIILDQSQVVLRYLVQFRR